MVMTNKLTMTARVAIFILIRFLLFVLSRGPERLAVLNRFGRNAQLLFKFLLGRPGIDLLHDLVRFCVGLWIVNRNGQFHVVMIKAPVAFLDTRVLAAGMSLFISPCSFVKAGRVDHESVVVR